MSEAFVDTNVIIRFVTGDDLGKQAAAVALFRRVQNGSLILRAPDLVIAEAVFVLTSRRRYHLSRERVAAELTSLLRLPGFLVHNRRLLLRALDLFASTRLDFADAMVIATMKRRGVRELYSYDHDFDRQPGINRIEP